MGEDSKDFLEEIQNDFLEETSGFLEETEHCFLELENNPENTSILEDILRLAHNIKGSAAAVGFDGLSHFSHQVENLLVKIKQDEISVTPGVVDVLLASNDKLKNFLEALRHDKHAVVDTTQIMKRLEDIMNHSSSEENFAQIESMEMNSQEHVSSSVSSTGQSDVFSGNSNGNSPFENSDGAAVKIEIVKDENALKTAHEKNTSSYKSLGTILLEDNIVTPEQLDKAVELQHKKLGEILVDQGALDEDELDSALKKQDQLNKKSKKVDDYIRLPLKKIEDLLNDFSEQVILQSSLEHYRSDVAGHADHINKTILQLSKITHELQQTAISLRMLSLKNIFNKMQRTVRDTAKVVGKDIRFYTDGEDTELDKTMIDELSSPLTHLLRNAVDHGIEDAATREKRNKPKFGQVWMKAFYRGRYFYLEIKDDGKGLDRAKIRSKAVRLGLVREDQELTEKDVLSLVFSSGFSTHDVATDISGRGVGMDAIKKAIEKLRGTIDVKSEEGKGMTITIRLPPTLAIFNGIIVNVFDRRYIVPSSEVYEIYHIDPKNIREVSPKEKIVKIKDDVFPLINLKKVFNLQNKVSDKNQVNDSQIVLLINFNEKFYALLVDDIVQQQRIVFKNIGREIEGLPGVAGGTILADGNVALILEINDIVELYRAGRI